MYKQRKHWHSIFVVCLIVLYYPQESVSAKRNDVLDALNTIQTNWENAGLVVSVNGRTEDPDVIVGEELSYKVHSAEPGYFTMVHVDSHGTVSIILPEQQSESKPKPFREVVYPLNGSLNAAPPLGQETLFVVMTDVQLDHKALGVVPGNDFIQGDDSLELVRRFQTTLSNHPALSKIAVEQLQYLVQGNSSTTEYTSRAIIRTFVDDPPKPIDAPSSMPAMKTFRNIGFDFDSAMLTYQGKMELDAIGGALNHKELEGMSFIFAGHTDDVGSSEYNENLSRRRASAALDYLTEMHGIDGHRIQVEAYGESKPLVPNTDSVSRAQNRRVELIRVE